MKIYSDMETVDDLHDYIREAVLEANVCDVQLHRAMQRMFSEELNLVKNKAFMLR